MDLVKMKRIPGVLQEPGPMRSFRIDVGKENGFERAVNCQTRCFFGNWLFFV
jgi:hypothetical protein